jgi:hypothetical protein
MDFAGGLMDMKRIIALIDSELSKLQQLRAVLVSGNLKSRNVQVIHLRVKS